ncbi:MAG TPA: sulfatase-like hydrolase/transferase [Candidatus Polarisedimenticolia bacterium]|nr:sulfatase-like hydrolase/transferase [Candidatus Polarisedimenticolia bacterium]
MTRPTGRDVAGRSPRRRALLALVLVLGSAALWRVVFRGPGGTPERPSVLLITIDTLRADRLGCYGYAAGETPQIDRLAAGGVLFEQASTAAPLTLPSHVSILTGTYPAFHGVRNNGTYRLGPEATTLAEVLQGKGDATGAVIGGYPLAARFGLAQGFDTYDDSLPPEGVRQLSYRERKGEEVTRAGLAFLEKHSRGRFFLWLHYFDPHAPYDPPAPYAERFRAAPYDGEVAYVDRQVGTILGALDRLGARRHTLVALLSDHGEGLGDHGEATHGVFLYQSTLRVPLVLSLPGFLPAGRRVTAPVRTIDLMPTILGLAGLAVPEDVEGTSLVALATGAGSGADPGLRAVAESVAPRENYGWSDLASIRIGDWKYIQAPRQELYDLRSDPSEKNDLAGARAADELARYREALDGTLSDSARRAEGGRRSGGDARSGAAGVRQDLDQTALERLRSLGYIWAPGPAAAGPLPDPKDRVALLRGLDEAGSLYVRGDVEAAIAQYGEILKTDPGNVTALTHRGNARLAAGDYAGAGSDFRAALVSRPASAELLANLGSALLGEGRLEEAGRVFQQALDVDPDSSRALAGSGTILARRGRPDEAGARLRQALASSPSDAAAALVLARLLYDASRFDEVVTLLDRSTRAGADTPEIRLALAGALFRQGENARAGQEYDKVLATTRPRAGGAGSGEAGALSGRALFGKALIALKESRTAEAIGLLERGRTFDPANVEARRNLAILYDEAGRDEAAIAEYRATLSLAPQARDIHFLRGRVYARTGRRREAAGQFRAYLAGGEGEFRDAARQELARIQGS